MKRFFFLFTVFVLCLTSCVSADPDNQDSYQVYKNDIKQVCESYGKLFLHELYLEGQVSLFPTQPDYLKSGAKYKSLISKKRWNKKGIERKIEEQSQGRDNRGRKYTLDDIGKVELKIAKQFNKNAQVIVELKDVPYDMYPWVINEYDENNSIVYAYSSTLYDNIQPFTENFYKELNIEKKQIL